MLFPTESNDEQKNHNNSFKVIAYEIHESS